MPKHNSKLKMENLSYTTQQAESYTVKKLIINTTPIEHFRFIPEQQQLN